MELMTLDREAVDRKNQHACILIQKTWRGHRGRTIALSHMSYRRWLIAVERAKKEWHACVLSKVLLIQKTWRGHVGRQKARHQRRLKGSHLMWLNSPTNKRWLIALERANKGWLVCNMIKNACILIQKTWRGHVGARASRGGCNLPCVKV